MTDDNRAAVRRIAVIDELALWLNEVVPSLQAAGYDVHRIDGYEVDHEGLAAYGPDLVVLGGVGFKELEALAEELVGKKHAVFAMPWNYEAAHMRSLFSLGCINVCGRSFEKKLVVSEVNNCMTLLDQRERGRPYR